jgi:hypothetical protein
MRNQKKIRFRGGPSEILESITYEGYEIRSLKHGITGNVLYCFPSEEHDWERCWTMDLQTAKNGVLKYNQHTAELNTSTK